MFTLTIRMDNNSDILELKFSGNGVSPSTVKPHEVAELIISFEKSLLATIKDQHPEIDTDELLFTFDTIYNESLDLRFIPKKVPEIVVSSYALISTSFKTGDFSNLNRNAVDSLKNITKFSKKYGCVGYFNHNGITLSTFTPKTEITIKKPIILKEQTTIFGTLIDAGGDNPNVHLRISDEQVLIFSTTHSYAKELATKLYERVALKGVAKWNADTLRIEDFKLTEILEYGQGKTSKAINDLKSLTSGFWDQYNNNDEINNQLLRD